jgi:hypothetical protein
MRTTAKIVRTIDTRDQFSHSPYAPLYSRLCENVVVLDAVEEARKTPKRVCFDCGEGVGRKEVRVKVFWFRI